MELTVYSGMSI